jgi:hypothetical protein
MKTWIIVGGVLICVIGVAALFGIAARTQVKGNKPAIVTMSYDHAVSNGTIASYRTITLTLGKKCTYETLRTDILSHDAATKKPKENGLIPEATVKHVCDAYDSSWWIGKIFITGRLLEESYKCSENKELALKGKRTYTPLGSFGFGN